VASSLLRAGEQRLARLGARRLTAIVETEERAAIEFWAALGYERQVGRGRFVKPVQPTAH
jgi:ribosomal protein S18 acetylase RimI-like enzyme